jgi:hypothetical protein
LLCSHPGGVAGAGRIRLAVCKCMGLVVKTQKNIYDLQKFDT